MTEHIKIKPINPRIQYLGNGSVTEFQFQFAIFSEDDITIYINQDEIISGFTVSGVGDSDGGYITFDVAPSDGDLITIIRELEIERVTDFQEGGTFRAKNINDELDKFTAYSQQVSEKIGRSLTIPPYVDGEVELSLPLPAAGKALKWNANETGLTNTSANIDEIASDAAASATSAATSATSAATSATSAATSATSAATSAAASANSASNSANTATLAQEWAAKMDGQVASTDYSSKYYAQRAATEASKAIGLEIGSLISSSLPILNAVKYVLADGTQYSTTGVYQAFADYLAQVKLTHPQCFVTQAEFDADVASTGQCGRYVLDTVNFRVPKITRYIGATVNLADIGKAWGESLPQHTHGITWGNTGTDYSLNSYRQDDGNLVKGETQSKKASNEVYQDGAKVNPERVTYPYYIVVSNAGQMTPVEIDINNVLTDLALKADKDLANTGLITNCITKIPQDIKLELNNGTLTLKAGSKLYMPNGVGVFSIITMTVDAVLGQVWGANNQVFVVYTPALGMLNLRIPADCSSGSTDSLSGRFHFWYDTANNLIKAVEVSGTARAEYLSFPLALVTMTGVGTAKVNSIDQVFNGFGYIGSTIFALPGVKGLIPNGRNADGSLKNIEFTNPVVRTINLSGTYNYKIALAITGLGSYAYAYDEIKNAIYRTDTGAYYNADRFIAGDISYTNGVITSFTTKTVFHALDWNDKETIVGWGMPDYNTGVDLAWNTTHQAEYDLFVVSRANLPEYTESRFLINGVIINSIYYGGGGGGSKNYVLAQMFIPKGSSYMSQGANKGIFTAYKLSGV